MEALGSYPKHHKRDCSGDVLISDEPPGSELVGDWRLAFRETSGVHPGEMLDSGASEVVEGRGLFCFGLGLERRVILKV